MLEWKKDWWKALIALAPMFIILIVFTFYPIINTIMVSFSPDYNYFKAGFMDYGKLGFDAYLDVFNDRFFLQSFSNTLIMVIIGVPLSIFVALLISVCLNSIPKVKGFFQTIFFLPYVTNGMAFGLVFATIFSPLPTGLMNSFIGLFGIEPVAWTGKSGVSFPTGLVVITINSIWSGLAFKILIFSSGLQSIDKQYYQAAQIDGAGKWRVFKKITFPLLSPVFLYVMITSLIGAFKSYSSIVSLFGEKMGGNFDKTFITAVGFIYDSFSQVQDGNASLLPKAAASAVVLFIVILIVTMLQMWYNKRRVHY